MIVVAARRARGGERAAGRLQVGYDQRSMTSRYESLVLDAIPPGCKRALDVGCGNGSLTRELRGRGIPLVVGIDSDGPCIQRCKDHPEAGDISYVVGDVLTSGLDPASFDVVSAVASLHHMDARSGLIRLRGLVAPGGVLVVIGLARSDLPKDIPIEVAAQIVSRVRQQPSKADSLPKPPTIWPPPERYATMRRLAGDLLPGVRWRRHLLWRYSLVWRNAEH
jgi:2-polyprenyl-3-methyl-5-hydroxy-6-metoxy-1,4-benzoquinol methylase